MGCELKGKLNVIMGNEEASSDGACQSKHAAGW